MDQPGFTITDGRGLHLTFANGWTISVQIGPGSYSDNHDMDFPPNRREPSVIGPALCRLPRIAGSSTAEIAAWGPDGAMQQFPDSSDTVSPYVTPADVLAWMIDIAGR